MKRLILLLLITSAFHAFSQNVGIGTTNPLSKLHVAGAIRSDTLIYVGPGVRSLFAAPNGRIYDSLVLPSTLNWEVNGNSNITPARFLGTTNANDVIFKTNNIERARIMANGNIGINTPAPSVLFTNSAFHSGDQSGLGTQVAMGMDWNANDMGYVASFYNSGITPGSSGALIKINDVTAGSKALTVNSGVIGSGTDLLTVLGNGNTGIGTNAPSQKLHIRNGLARIDGGSNTATNAAYLIFGLNNGTDLGYVGDGASGDNNTYLWSYNDAVQIGTGATALPSRSIYLNQLGNVGIGTLTPANKLEITSVAANTSGLRFTNLTAVSPTVATNGKALSVDANGDVVLVSSASNAWDLLGNAGTTAGTNFLGTTDAQDLVFKTNNTERIRTLASNGNVGVATVAPLSKLNVVDRFNGDYTTLGPFTKLVGVSVDDNSDFIGMSTEDMDGNLTTTNDASGLIYWGDDGNEPLNFKYLRYNGANFTPLTVATMLPNGNVGIGSPTPGARLEVVETNSITASSIARFSRVGTGSNGWLSLFSGAASSDWNGMTQTGDKSIIFTNDNDPLLSANSGLLIAPWTTSGNPLISSGIKIMENGNVGISVGAPTKKLEITSSANSVIYATRNFNGIGNDDAGFIGGVDASYTNTGVYFVQKDNISLGSYATNLMNIVSNGSPQVVVNGTGNMRIGSRFYGSQCGGTVVPDVANVKLSVMGGFSAFGSFNNDPLANAAPPSTSWVNGVGALVLGMNRQAGTSNVDFWNASDPNNGGAALTPTDRGFNWRNFNSVAGACNENLLMTLNGLGNLTIAGTNYFTSDRRLKTGIQPFTNSALEKIMKIQPSTYIKNTSGFDANGNIVFGQNGTAINDFGFIAQDLYTVFPELVYKPANESKELWGVDYSRLSVILTKAMQEQQLIIESQEERIQKLEKALLILLEKKD